METEHEKSDHETDAHSDQKHQVHFSSAWTGNIVLIVIVLVILAAGLAYTEFFA